MELIIYAKRAGFTLAQIRSLRENASLGEPPATLWHDLAARKAVELNEVIVRAEEAKKRLVALSQCRCRNLAKCGELLRDKAATTQILA